MDRDRYQGTDKHPIREYLRANCPKGREGFVVEDLDLVVRLWGPRYGTDDRGTLKLIEVKRASGEFETAQQRTFGLLDGLLRRGDPDGTRYGGFYLLRHNIDGEWTDDASLSVNGEKMTAADFCVWAQGGGPLIQPRKLNGGAGVA
jgi:hypothetical protein